MINARLPDGRVLRFPNDTPENVIQSTIKSVLSEVSGPRAFDIGAQGQAIEKEFVAPPEKTFLERAGQDISASIVPRGTLGSPESVTGGAEAALALGTGAVGEIASGVVGAAALPTEMARGQEEMVPGMMQGIQQKVAYQPRSEAGQQKLQQIGELAEGIPNVGKAMGDYAMELTGSPAFSAAVSTVPTMIGEVVGLKWLQKLRPGTKLIDEAGNPTKLLRKKLDENGLDFESLSPEVKAEIPSTVEHGMIRKPKPDSAIEDIVKEQIKSGGNEASLAGLKISGNQIKPDVLANKAIRQGWEPADIQPIKTSTSETKQGMRKMLGMMRRIKKDSSLALEINPIDVIGDSIGNRIGYIRNQTNKYRAELNQIAEKNLKKTYADPGLVNQTINNTFDKLEVGLKRNNNGKLVPDFEGSDITEAADKRLIRETFEEVQRNITGDAYRYHKLKKRLDSKINWDRKKLISKASPAGEKAVKEIRGAVNDTLRALDKRYADVNDTLSASLTAIEDFDKSVGNIEILGRGSNQAIGRKAMTLLSKNHGVTKIRNAVDQLDEVAGNLGGKFDDDPKRLIMFQNALNKRLGAQESTSFAGQITEALQGTARKMGMGKKEMLVEGIGAAGEGVKKMVGINEFNAFEAMNDLLTKGLK